MEMSAASHSDLGCPLVRSLLRSLLHSRRKTKGGKTFQSSENMLKTGVKGNNRPFHSTPCSTARRDRNNDLKSRIILLNAAWILYSICSQYAYLITCLCTLVQLVVSGLSTFPAVVDCMIVGSSIVW